MKTTILMTACINPCNMVNTAVKNIDTRKKEYIEALKYYLQRTKFDIVFVENSGTDISSFFIPEIKHDRLEMITYSGNHFSADLGKGFGEGEILRYAFTNSRKLHQECKIYKISGRHIVKNIGTIDKLSNLLRLPKHFILCDFNPKYQSAISDLFLGTRDFYTDFLLPFTFKIDESKGIWFEHVLYKAIRSYSEKGLPCFLPCGISQIGQSGSTGMKLKKGTIKGHIRNFIKALLYRYHYLEIR